MKYRPLIAFDDLRKTERSIGSLHGLYLPLKWSNRSKSVVSPCDDSSRVVSARCYRKELLHTGRGTWIVGETWMSKVSVVSSSRGTPRES